MYRPGSHHQTTIIDESDIRPCALVEHDCARGHMVAVVLRDDATLAERICALLNAAESLCICSFNGVDPDCRAFHPGQSVT